MTSTSTDFGDRFDRFIDDLTEGQYKPTARAVRDVIYGILQSRSTVLAQIARSLGEGRRLIHTEKRLSERLKSDRFDDCQLQKQYLKLVAPQLRDKKFRRPTIACDVTDIGKPWANKMGHLAPVRDGSSPVRRVDASGRREPVIQSGFEMLAVEAVGEKGRRLPLHAQLYSPAEPGWLGFRPLLRKTILAVKPHVPKECIWAFDRGHDGYETIETIARTGVNFVVRMKSGLRTHIWANGEKVHVDDAIAGVELGSEFLVERYAAKGKNVWRVKVGWIDEVRLPATKSGHSAGRQPGARRLSMVVLTNNRGNKKPIVILTNLKVRSEHDARVVANAYHDRWGAEEGFRFLKSELGLEKMRAFKWQSLKRLAMLAMLAYGYLAYLVHTAEEAVRTVAKKFKAFGKVPIYLFYRMIDGVSALIRSPEHP